MIPNQIFQLSYQKSVVKPANDDRKFVVAEGLLDSLAEKFGWESFEVLAKH